MSALVGEGHNATGRALEEAAREVWPGVEVQWLDVLRVMGPGVGPLLRRVYSADVEHAPWLYEFFYRAIRDQAWFRAGSKRFIAAWAGRRLEAPVVALRPEAIISTHPMGIAGLAWLRGHRGLWLPLGTWLTDFAPHPFWVFPEIDLTLVVHELAVPEAQRGTPGARIAVSAPPVRARFRPQSRAAARRAFDLPDAAFVAVVTGGSLGFGDLASVGDTVLDAAPETVAMVVTGHNEPARQHVLRHGDRSGRLRALGWVDDMPRLYAAADVVITNAGGAIGLEALSCGRPVLMYRPLPAHGRANAEMMTRAGLTQVYHQPESLRQGLRDLARDPGRLAELERAALDFAGSRRLAGSLQALLEAAAQR